MAVNDQDLSGLPIYFCFSYREDPLAEQTEFESLVGEGKLIARPNEVVVERGSMWVHERAVKHTYSVFDRDIVSISFGRSKNARCKLMFPLDWWFENKQALSRLKSADIGYGIFDAEGMMAVYAGRFMPTKEIVFPPMMRSGRSRSGDLKFDKTKPVHYEFVCIGNEVFAMKDRKLGGIAIQFREISTFDHETQLDSHLPVINPHSQFSALRETILEHAFLGDLGKELWKRGHFDTEILRAEFDSAGYDIVVRANNITRHIQLKVRKSDGRAAGWGISERLAEKPSGCVIVMFVDGTTLQPLSFGLFAGSPGCPLPDLSGFSLVKHTKGDSTGFKAERPGHRNVPKSQFKTIPNIEALCIAMFGSHEDSRHQRQE